MNILLLSVGMRNKVVQYFKKAFGQDGNVIATDMSELAPALYEADRHYIVPRITESGYLDVIIDICQREQINGVLSLIDPELSLLAEHTANFAKVGTQVIGSSYELCEMSLDKWKMYQWLRAHGYNCAKKQKKYIIRYLSSPPAAAPVLQYQRRRIGRRSIYWFPTVKG